MTLYPSQKISSGSSNLVFSHRDERPGKDSLSAVLKENPDSIGALNLLGTIYEEENNYVEALKPIPEYLN